MSIEKQIDEIETILCCGCQDIPVKVCHNRGLSCDRCRAEMIYNAGYRKQRENVIELPCKVGDTIFVIRNDIIEQETVRGIKIGNCGLYLQVSRGFDDFEYHYDIEIGNKLFFEKEEAEAKMKGGAE